MLTKILECCKAFNVKPIYWDHDRLEPHENDLRDYPAEWIKKTIEILKLIDGNTIVEIGSTRLELTQKCIDYYNDGKVKPPCCQDGHSTYFWAREGFNVHTVDINESCKQALISQYEYHIKEPLPDNLTINIPCDGIDFLKNFKGQIDLLYLDGWDKGTHEYGERHLDAFKAAEDKLAEKHIISIDDTDFVTPDGGKDILLTPHLLNNGYIKVLEGRQSVFVKENI